jgi:tetratricopeptide (TPR) repeat protein
VSTSLPNSPAPVESWEVLDLLTGLVEKSLVVYEEDEQGRGRYRLLETVRQYGRDRLLESGETQVVRDRHLRFCEELGQTAEPQLRSQEQIEWLDLLEAEHDNLRAALAWSLDSGTEGGARLAEALVWFWFLRSYWREGSQWLNAWLVQPEKVAADRAGLLAGRGALAYSQGDMAACEASFQECLALDRAEADQWWVALALAFTAMTAVARRECERAMVPLLEGIALARAMNDPWLEAWILLGQGLVSSLDDDGDGLARAVPFWEEGLVLAEAVGERFIIGILLANLGEVALRGRELARATSLLQRGLRLNCELGQRALAALFLEGIAAVMGATGQPRLGVQLAGASAALREAANYPVEALDHGSYPIRLAMARANLSKAEFAAAWEEGQTMPLEQAVAAALSFGGGS